MLAGGAGQEETGVTRRVPQLGQVSCLEPYLLAVELPLNHNKENRRKRNKKE